MRRGFFCDQFGEFPLPEYGVMAGELLRRYCSSQLERERRDTFRYAILDVLSAIFSVFLIHAMISHQFLIGLSLWELAFL